MRWRTMCSYPCQVVGDRGRGLVGGEPVLQVGADGQGSGVGSDVAGISAHKSQGKAASASFLVRKPLARH